MDRIDQLFARAKEKDKKAREILIERNLNLVRYIAKRFEDRGVAAEDLFQIGVIGLIKAVDRFDPAYGVKFSSYAVPVISGEIKRFFREDGLIKISRAVRENGIKIRKVTAEYENRYGRAPTLREVQEKTKLKEDEILLAMEAGDALCPLGEVGDALPEPESTEEKVLDRMVLGELMQTLSDTERKVIIMRFFEEISQTEIAERLAMTQVQVCRMEKRVLKRLRECVLW